MTVIPQGAIRFNTDSSKMECYDGEQWWEISMSSPDLGKYTNSDKLGGARGIIGGGADPAHSNMIQAFDLTSAGSCFDFGNLSEAVRYAVGGGNQIRGIRAGGYDGSRSEVIEYFSISVSPASITNFGDLSLSKFVFLNGAASQTRSLFPAGGTPGFKNTIEYVTTATTGNAADFGDQTSARGYCMGLASNAIRGIFAGGSEPSDVNKIDYVIIATLGNAIDFGDLSYSAAGVANSSSPTRGVFAGGGPSPGRTNIEYVQIMTTGNAVDFGDLTYSANYASAISNGYGGL